ncbi:MAG: deoxyribodipyrimidine photolyase [Aureliella sp.]
MQQEIETQVPSCRIRNVGDRDLVNGKYVVYWMTAFRRVRSNFALQYARDLAIATDSSLLILDALRIGYRWASVRMHRFVIEGMVDNQQELKACEKVAYYPYVEPEKGAAGGLVEELAKSAVAVVTDDYPCFFHPALLRLASKKLSCPVIAVDSNGLMPIRYPDRTFTVAHSYRRYTQKELPAHLRDGPDGEPLSADALAELKPAPALRRDWLKRWPKADLKSLLKPDGLADFAIDQSVQPAELQGGAKRAGQLLEQFVSRKLGVYSEDRNEPDLVGSSELSPYLHFGHISSHDIFNAVMHNENWTPDRLNKPNGKMNGFWGVGENAEAFLDQLCTWREIGFNMCARERKYDRLETLPDWTQKSIAEHADDPRQYVYSLEEFEQAKTHDKLWNAAQRQLVFEGRIHNYLRMLWGKKILHWTASVKDALDIMVHLNNKYALDGRDPNSYSGIFWVLGRYDRAWGPVRPIFGKVRYMASENTAKKYSVKQYLKRYADN